MSIAGILFKLPSTKESGFPVFVDGNRFFLIDVGVPTFENERYPFQKVTVGVPVGGIPMMKMFLDNGETNSISVTGGRPVTVSVPISKSAPSFKVQQSFYKDTRDRLEELKGEEGAGKERGKAISTYHKNVGNIPSEEMLLKQIVLLESVVPMLSASPTMITTNDFWSRISKMKISSPVTFTGIVNISLATKQASDSWDYGRKIFASGASGRTFAALHDSRTKIHLRILAQKNGADRIATMEQAIRESGGELFVMGDVSMAYVDKKQVLTVLVSTYRKLTASGQAVIDTSDFGEVEFGVSDGEAEGEFTPIVDSLDMNEPVVADIDDAADDDLDDDIPF
jgi:hypothetical protein